MGELRASASKFAAKMRLWHLLGSFSQYEELSEEVDDEYDYSWQPVSTFR
jgi:hypothetical protein